VFAGKTLSETQAPKKPATTKPKTITRRDLDLTSVPGDEKTKDLFDLEIMNPELGRRIGDWRLQPKQEIADFQISSKDNSRFPYGQPVYNLYNREYVTNKMNNVPPIERMNVGPGLGVDPDTPATGGFQQFFRVLPNNINEERLTTLPGAEGPPNPVVKNGQTMIGNISHPAKASKTAYKAPIASRGQGQGGAITGAEGRPDQIKTRRTTIRQETGERNDGLSYGTAQYKVYQGHAIGNNVMARGTNNRSNPDRAGNGGRMNVRLDPSPAIGAMTNLKIEDPAFNVGPVTPGQGRFSQYIKSDFDKFNEKKTISGPNPRAAPDSLDIAIRQLEKNPLALPISAA
jgi:hypothetical protein